MLRFPRRVTYLYFAVSIAVISTYFLTYKTPAHHPSLTKINPLKTLEYIPIYLGGIFSDNIIIASIIGIIGLIAVTGFVGYWLFGKKVDRTDWPLMAAVSRSGFGVEQATASRYATLPALFWMSTFVLTVLWVRQLQPIPRMQRSWLTPLLGIVTIAIVLMYGVGGETASAIARRATYQPLVALSLQLGITDVTLIKDKVGNRPAAFVMYSHSQSRKCRSRFRHVRISPSRFSKLIWASLQIRSLERIHSNITKRSTIDSLRLIQKPPRLGSHANHRRR